MKRHHLNEEQPEAKRPYAPHPGPPSFGSGSPQACAPTHQPPSFGTKNSDNKFAPWVAQPAAPCAVKAPPSAMQIDSRPQAPISAATASGPQNVVGTKSGKKDPIIISIIGLNGSHGAHVHIAALAFAFIKSGQRVLCVDADPTCQLSQLLRHLNEVEASATNDGRSAGRSASSSSAPTPHHEAPNTGSSNHVDSKKVPAKEVKYTGWSNNIHSLLKPYFESKDGFLAHVPTLSPVPGHSNLFLIPGSLHFMNADFHVPPKPKTAAETFKSGAFRSVVRQIASKINANIILVAAPCDFGPVAKVVTQNCDYVLPITNMWGPAPLHALEFLINNVYPSWNKWHKTAREIQRRKQKQLEKPSESDLAWAHLLGEQVPALLPLLVFGYQTELPPNRSQTPTVASFIETEVVTESCDAWFAAAEGLMNGNPDVKVTLLNSSPTCAMAFMKNYYEVETVIRYGKVMTEMYKERTGKDVILDRTERLLCVSAHRYLSLAKDLTQLERPDTKQ